MADKGVCGRHSCIRVEEVDRMLFWLWDTKIVIN